MKKFLKITAVAALMFVTMTSMADDSKISLVSGNEAKNLILKVGWHSDGSVQLTDQKGNTLFSKSVLNSDYTKGFNMKNLDAGTYYLSVANSLRSVVFTLNLENSEVKIVKEDKSYRPFFKKAGDKIYLNLYNVGQETVAIKIVDSRHQEVFRKSIKGELIIGEVFNFEKAFKDTYTLMVTNDKNTYYQDIKI
ncbi:MAG: hypothetical protein ACJA2S_005314 [Cyclobacteriaceae bacterium]|jgi:hypothetical protein